MLRLLSVAVALCAVLAGVYASDCDSDELAVYRVHLDTHWSRELFPKQYPEWRPPAGWSRLVGRSHDASFSLYREGDLASPGLQLFAEKGHTDALESADSARGGVYDEFTAPAVPRGVGRTAADFFLDGNHSLVSVAARIVPSPDWFIGIDSLDLCRSGHWIDSIAIQVDPMDAGTDNGFTFTAPNWPSEPKAPVARITSKKPSHPANSFFYPDLDQLPPIATFTFVKSARIDATNRTEYEELAWELARVNCSTTDVVDDAPGPATPADDQEIVYRCLNCDWALEVEPAHAVALENRTYLSLDCVRINCTDLDCTGFTTLAHDTASAANTTNTTDDVTHLYCVPNNTCFTAGDCSEGYSTAHLNCSEYNGDVEPTELKNTSTATLFPSEPMNSTRDSERSSSYICRVTSPVAVNFTAERDEWNNTTTISSIENNATHTSTCIDPRAISTRSALYFSPTLEQLESRTPIFTEEEIDDIDELLEERVYHLSVESRNSSHSRDPLEGADLSNDVGPAPALTPLPLPVGSSSGDGVDAAARRVKSRNIKKSSRHAKGCHVSEWSEWSPCSVSCGVGDATRTRRVLTHPRRGGRPCPTLEEKRWCGGHSECPQNFFNW